MRKKVSKRKTSKVASAFDGVPQAKTSEEQHARELAAGALVRLGLKPWDAWEHVEAALRKVRPAVRR